MVWRPSGEVERMGWTRMTRRTADRYHRRPDMEALEVRTLLSTTQSQGIAPLTIVAPAGSAGTTSTSGTDYDTIVGASVARAAYKVDGSGSTVAVIDAGVNYNNAALGGGFG